MPYDASHQALRQFANLWRRTTVEKGLLEIGDRLKDLLVFVINFRDKHGMRCAPLQGTHVPFYKVQDVDIFNSQVLSARPRSAIVESETTVDCHCIRLVYLSAGRSRARAPHPRRARAAARLSLRHRPGGRGEHRRSTAPGPLPPGFDGERSTPCKLAENSWRWRPCDGAGRCRAVHERRRHGWTSQLKFLARTPPSNMVNGLKDVARQSTFAYNTSNSFPGSSISLSRCAEEAEHEGER